MLLARPVSNDHRMLCPRNPLERLHLSPRQLQPQSLHRTRPTYPPTKLLEEHVLVGVVATGQEVQRAVTGARLTTTVFPRVLILAEHRNDRVVKVEVKARSRSLFPLM